MARVSLRVALWSTVLCVAGCGTGTNLATPTAVPVVIVTKALPAGTAGVTYGASIQAANGTAPYTYALTSGTLPSGLSFEGGVVEGVPAAATTTSFTVTVTDAKQTKATAAYSLQIAPPLAPTLNLTPGTLPVGLVNTSYSAVLTASGGTAPYTFTESGTLPSGLTLASNGTIAGMALASGTYPVTVHVTDSSVTPGNATLMLTLNVADAAVQANMKAPIGTVPQTFFGMHTSVYDPGLNDVAQLPGLLADTGITTLRFPGGGFSDNYHWAQHTMTPNFASTSPACGTVPNGYLSSTATFADFLKTMLASGAQALITVNYGTSVANAQASRTVGSDGQDTCSEPNQPGQPQEAAAWVAYANGDPSNTHVIGLDAAGFDWKTVGYWATMRAAYPLGVDDGYNFLRIGHVAPIGIKYWEIGNEVYYNGWATNHNAEDDLHSAYVYPNGYSGTFSTRASLAALSPTAYGTNAIAWLQAMKAVDPTIKIGVTFSSPGPTDPIPLTWNPELAQAVCAGGLIDMALIHYYPGTWNAVQPSELVTLPQSDIPRVVTGIQQNLAQYCPANASQIQFFMTESSPNGKLATGFPLPVVGLFALDEYMTSLQTGIVNVDWLELHNSTYLDPNENPEPVFYGLQLVHLLAGVGDSIVPASSTSSSVLSWASLKSNGQKGVLLLNTSATNAALVQVTIAGATVGSTAMEYSFGVNTTQSGTMLLGTSVAVSNGTVTVNVPAYTAVEVLAQ